MRIKPIIIILLVLTAVAYPLKMAADAVYAKDVNAVDTSTGSGTQDSTAKASSVQTIDGRTFINNLGPNEYTPDTYVVPQYDPFNNQHRAPNDYKESYPPLVQPDAKPEPVISIGTTQKGFADVNSGTAGTEFIFSASGSRDSETPSGNLRVRWDFESDGIPDTYFSTTKSARHIYANPGIYYVTVEVLDAGGAVGKATKQVIVVNNTPPSAYLIAKKTEGTVNSVFDFDTSKSSDSQYKKEYLKYRFDWDNNGVWDTQYAGKTTWNHKFEKSGQYHVVMQVKDPEGLTTTYYRDIKVTDNNPPVASFTINKSKSGAYTFDASGSKDIESQNKLKYRWDFNYTGPDDIAYDTQYSQAKKHTGIFSLPGTKTVRLEVIDEDGATDTAYARILIE
jgi:hypothetical protein